MGADGHGLVFRPSSFVLRGGHVGVRHNGAVKLEYVTLCDYAGLDGKGKANLIGVFSVFEPPTVPMRLGRFYIAMFFKAEKKDSGTEPKLKVRLLDENGTVANLDQELQLGLVPAATLADGEVGLNLFVEVNGIKVARYGKYQLVVEVDGVRAGKISVGVRKPGESSLVGKKE